MQNFAFFGSSQFSVYVLDELKKAGFVPSLVVSTPDKPKGRKLLLSPTPVTQWARDNGVAAILTPAKLDEAATAEIAAASAAAQCQAFVVASYGLIIPQRVLDIPPHGTLNVHPSLLPKHRGATPLQSAMLEDDKQTGVTIMAIDAKMDHGPLVAQKQTPVADLPGGEWPIYEAFQEHMAREGGRLLAETLPRWIAGEIEAREQDHAAATFTKKIAKEDGLVSLGAPDQYSLFRKIQAYHQWPGAYFFIQKDGASVRVKIARASFAGGKLQLERVIPEGGKEMGYADFARGYLGQA